ncbi:carboxymuconolactone decarboxylase family protein [Paenibacillus flagellatus]|uniref:Carboxymuconolactone decarboxylase family protein n=1 Tax=Paenibacillus flagellatus TaxID=2211139 RepID=A0A2V5KK02_9BACL|nr:carboxymuconolactone decarboxylase family protein [Paenibacillus flagellatus]PYI50827.1 carboxymuconolactone decarboxylase family protein [Paenibacillus flagellatus]
MEQRLNMQQLEPKAYEAMYGLERYVRSSSIPKTLLELIKIRASQLNGCAYCIDMHTKDARHYGETEQRIYALNAWRETPFFTPEERAALALTEAVTLVAETHVPDDVYEEAAKVFEPNLLAQIIMAIVTINAWNRIAVTMRAVPGSYKPGAFD